MPAKEALRAQLRERRAVRSPMTLAELETAIAHRSLAMPRIASAQVVACYLSAGPEPPTWALVDALSERGVTVLAPVMAPGRTLDWATYTGDTAEAAYGIREPTGQRLGPTALASVDAIILPALAVDYAGHRLGRGAGYYDRALAATAADAVRIAVVFDDELLDSVPTEGHDMPVHYALTPQRTWDCTAPR